MARRYTSAELAAHLEAEGKTVDFVVRKESKRDNQESRDQQDLIKWWANACVKFGVPERMLMAFPLQGARTPQNGARMKAEGMRAGTCDLFLAVARGGFHGLWIEMKTKTGVVSDAQLEMLRDLNLQDYSTAVCRSYSEAVAEIGIYLQKIEILRL